VNPFFPTTGRSAVGPSIVLWRVNAGQARKFPPDRHRAGFRPRSDPGTDTGSRAFNGDESQLRRPAMPAKSKAQQKAAGAALSAKRGETPVSELQGASREMYDSMTEQELDDLASTRHKGLPRKKSED
jgi:hypothetical protein